LTLGVVDIGIGPDSVAELAAQQVIDGSLVVFATDVPQGGIKSADETQLDIVGMLLGQLGIELVVEIFSIEGVFTLQLSIEDVTDHFFVSAFKPVKRSEDGGFTPTLKTVVSFELDKKPPCPTFVRRLCLDDESLNIG
jgi:hypothetical protein